MPLRRDVLPAIIAQATDRGIDQGHDPVSLFVPEATATRIPNIVIITHGFAYSDAWRYGSRGSVTTAPVITSITPITPTPFDGLGIITANEQNQARRLREAR